MRDPTVDPNEKIERLTVTWNIRNLRMTESIARAPQIICRWPFGTPDDLRAQARHPCHCPATDEIADEIAAASLLYMATSKISSTPQQTQKTNNLCTSHMVKKFGEELDFYLTTKQHCMPI